MFSFGSILGFVAGVGLFLGAILTSTDNAAMFLNLPSFVMVVGGTLSSAFLGFQSRYVLMALTDIVRLFGVDPVNRNMIRNETLTICKWGQIAQKGGPVALEKNIKGLREPFLSYGMELIMSNYSGNEIRDLLSQAARANFQRQSARTDILRNMGATAPAFGMIGTLVGLVIMLDTMGADPGSIGKGLAIALLTTLYGVIAARLVFLPAASKLQQRSEISMFRDFLITEGFALIAEGKSPRFIRDRMNSFLDPSLHITDAELAANKG